MHANATELANAMPEKKKWTHKRPEFWKFEKCSKGHENFACSCDSAENANSQSLCELHCLLILPFLKVRKWMPVHTPMSCAKIWETHVPKPVRSGGRGCWPTAWHGVCGSRRSNRLHSVRMSSAHANEKYMVRTIWDRNISNILAISYVPRKHTTIHDLSKNSSLKYRKRCGSAKQRPEILMRICVCVRYSATCTKNRWHDFDLTQPFQTESSCIDEGNNYKYYKNLV